MSSISITADREFVLTVVSNASGFAILFSTKLYYRDMYNDRARRNVEIIEKT